MSKNQINKTIIEITSNTPHDAMQLIKQLHEQNIYGNNELYQGQAIMKVMNVSSEDDIETDIEQFEKSGTKIEIVGSKIIYTIPSKMNYE